MSPEPQAPEPQAPEPQAGAIVVVTGSVFIELFWPRLARLLGAQGA